MKIRSLSVLCFSALLAALSAFAAPAPALAQEGAPTDFSGRVTMTMGRGAFLISATGGNGELSFQGSTYRFKLGGMGLGLIGFTRVEAEGEVYELSNVGDFAGTYFQGSYDWAAGSGEGVLWLKNTKGVWMKLRSKTKGVSLAVGGEGLVVQMEGAK
jgi:hypothetical protein